LTDIKVHKSGEDLLRQLDIGVTTKSDSKFTISGAVIRIEVMPGPYADSEYKISVWVPNAEYDSQHEDKKKNGGRQFEVNTKNFNYIGFKEFMAALVEAATGSKPKNGNESVTMEIFGFPVTIKETDRDDKETITENVNPTEEKLPPVKVEAKVEIKNATEVEVDGNKVKATNAGFRYEGKDGAVRVHDSTCQCDPCTQVRQALRELTEGINRGTTVADNSGLPTDLTLHPQNCSCFRCLQNDMGYY
jgi:hypothetical protein